MSETPNADATSADQPQFRVERIYVKDVSFEAPHSPGLFLEKWQPDVHLDIQMKSQALQQGTHEVELSLTLEVKKDEQAVIMVEIKQAGIFTVEGFPEAQAKPIIGVHCPTILYPYAQQLCAQLVQQGGYPPLYLAPINFEAMYQQQQQADADAAAATDEA